MSWLASTDDTGVALYNVHRSAASGFQPSAANQVGQSTTTSFTNTGVAAGTYYYVVTAQDVAGNVSDPSNEAGVSVPPTPRAFGDGHGPGRSGKRQRVDHRLGDGVGRCRRGRRAVQARWHPARSGGTTPPYSLTWNTTTTSNETHTLTAVARDASGKHVRGRGERDGVEHVGNAERAGGAAYGFNEANGVLQVTDASGQGNTGTISGATRTASGKFGRALSFNGTSAWVTVADAASLDLTTGMTIEAWVRPSALTGWRTVVLKEAPSGLAYALYSGNGASRAAGYVSTGTGADIGVNGTSNLVLNTWTHVAVTHDGATLRMFVNGVEANSEAASGAVTTSTGVLRIGGNAYWGEYFKGIMDEVRIYNRALTASEIQADMVTPIP